MTEDRDDLARKIDLLVSQHQMERKIFEVGYAIEKGDFQRVGELMGHATIGSDRQGRKTGGGSPEAIRDGYLKTNIVYPDRGRASKEIYHNILVDIDLDDNRATSVTSYTVALQPPGDPFELLVAGMYEDEWERVDGEWRWVDRYVVVQYMNNLDKHMHSGSQPYN